MDAQVKKLWLTALDTYPQAKGALRTPQGFCCLGVLCDQYQKLHPDNSRWEQKDSGSYDFVVNPGTKKEEVEIAYLPMAVITWAGLNDPNPMTKRDNDFGDRASLAGLNDGDRSFQFIAQIIREEF